ncbi:sigma-70 family RNA polymerase sigma factor [Levilactobacillus brevis]
MDLQQYEHLVTQLATEVRRYLINRGAQPEVVADIVQDVFVKLLEMELVLPPEKLRPYMYRVAWSTYLDQYRRTRRYQLLVRQYLIPTAVTVVRPIDDGDLTAALQKLSAKEQRLLVLRYDQALSLAEIAKQLGIRLAAVKMRLHRVHRKLEKIMRGTTYE